MKNLSMLVTQGNNLDFLFELGGVAAAGETGGREDMDLCFVGQWNGLDEEEWSAGNYSHLKDVGQWLEAAQLHKRKSECC